MISSMISPPTPSSGRQAQVPTFLVVAVLALAGLGVLWVLFTAEPKPAQPAPEGPQHWLSALGPDGAVLWRIGMRNEFAGDDFRVERLYSSPEGGLVGYIAHETVRGEAQDWMGIFNARGNPVWKRSKTIHDCLFPDEQSVAIVDSAPGEVYQLHLYDIKSPQLWWVPIELPDGVPFHLELLPNKSLAVVHGAPADGPGLPGQGLILLVSAHGDVLFELTPSQYARRPVRDCAFRHDGSFVVEGRAGELISYDAQGDEEWRTEPLEPARLVAGASGEVYCVSAELPGPERLALPPRSFTFIDRDGKVTMSDELQFVDPSTLTALPEGGFAIVSGDSDGESGGWRLARFAMLDTVLWQMDLEGQLGRPLALTLIAGRWLQVEGQGTPLLLDAATGDVAAYPPLTEDGVWSADGGSYYTWRRQPGEVQAWDAAGRQRWAFSEPPSQLSCPPHAATGGVVYVVTTEPPSAAPAP